jgi:8-hydroxy-5-deazaflavin:NADPH oxidoreductase
MEFEPCAFAIGTANVRVSAALNRGDYYLVCRPVCGPTILGRFVVNTEDRFHRSRRDFLQSAGIAAAGLAAGALSYAARAASSAERGLKIGIIGSGNMGGTLGALWLKAGHEIMFSSLDLDHDQALAARLGGKARAGTPREAAAFGEVLLIAVPYSALPQLGRDLAYLIRGKVVLDTCNPVPVRDGEIAAWARGKGVGLATAELLPGARLVRAFNSPGGTARLSEVAKHQAQHAGMPIASDDEGAIAVASRLIHELGYEPVMIGPLAMGKYLLPGTPLAGEHTPEQIRQILATLN